MERYLEEVAVGQPVEELDVKGGKFYEVMDAIALIVTIIQLLTMFALLCEGMYSWWQKKGKHDQVGSIVFTFAFSLFLVSLNLFDNYRCFSSPCTIL